jgi:hypothetical protein
MQSHRLRTQLSDCAYLRQLASAAATIYETTHNGALAFLFLAAVLVTKLWRRKSEPRRVSVVSSLFCKKNTICFHYSEGHLGHGKVSGEDAYLVRNRAADAATVCVGALQDSVNTI